MTPSLYVVRIDLPRLREKLSHGASRSPLDPLPVDDVFGWLADHGFEYTPRNRWIATADAITRLDVAEILECESLT